MNMLVLNMTIVVIGMKNKVTVEEEANLNIETKKDSYAFLDVERRFGNGNKNSYQINGGFYWAL